MIKKLLFKSVTELCDPLFKYNNITVFTKRAFHLRTSVLFIN